MIHPVVRSFDENAHGLNGQQNQEHDLTDQEKIFDKYPYRPPDNPENSSGLGKRKIDKETAVLPICSFPLGQLIRCRIGHLYVMIRYSANDFASDGLSLSLFDTLQHPFDQKR